MQKCTALTKNNCNCKNNAKKDGLCMLHHKLKEKEKRGKSASDAKNTIDTPICCICQEETSDPKDCRTLACGHTYHKSCLIQMIVRNGKTCAICRRQIRGINKKDIPALTAAIKSYNNELVSKIQIQNSTYLQFKDEFADMQQRIAEATRYLDTVQRQLLGTVEKALPTIKDIKRLEDMLDSLDLNKDGIIDASSIPLFRTG
tara:strand:+ start:10421 stop:11026 length:606 start_codon:yes stop_codon:yes gene_type:complete